MLSKLKFPYLNRSQRRNPKKFVEQINLNKGWAGGGHWLLMGLLERGGYNAKRTDGALL
jgi:hypothetical protein